ncbi:hypothetical protein HK101_003790 [Irineochytrium annulatum]|nr:hypothetical protein HK101_003790 [Irineochytrium annulatum]
MLSTCRAAVLACLVVFATADISFLQQNMYQGIRVQGNFGVLSGNGFTGSSSTLTNGILYQCQNSADVEGLLSLNQPFVQYAVVMPFALFEPYAAFRRDLTAILPLEYALNRPIEAFSHSVTIAKLRNSNKLSGIIVVEQHPLFPRAPSYSADQPFPNFQYSLYANNTGAPYQWNPNGNGLLQQGFDFPVMLMPVTPNDVSWVQSLGSLIEALEYNKNRSYVDYPLYAVEFDGLMYAAINSPTCLRRGFCNVIGGLSTWSTFSYNMSRQDTREIIVVTASMDSNAMFRDSTFGAETTTSGFVTLIAVADALAQSKTPIHTLPKDLLFTAFGAEAWGFAGSQRFVQDIAKPFTCTDPVPSVACPACGRPCLSTTNFTQIGFDRISAIFEFNQVAGIGLPDPANPTIFLHIDDAADPLHAGFATGLKWNGSVLVRGVDGTNVTVTFGSAFGAGVNNRLPPSSAMSFLAKKKIPAAVFSDFSLSYTNKYYNSEYDDGTTWNATHSAIMCGLATKAAQTIYEAAGGDATGARTLAANCTLVHELFECFTRNISCFHLDQYYNVASAALTHFWTSPQYPSVFTFGSAPSYIPYFVHSLLTNATAVNRTGSCTNDTPAYGPNFFCLAGTCVQSLSFYHDAYGTGLEYNYGTGTFEVVDATKAAWTESMYVPHLLTPYVFKASYRLSNRWNAIRMRVFKQSSPAFQGMQLAVGFAFCGVAGGVTYVLSRTLKKRFKID